MEYIKHEGKSIGYIERDRSNNPNLPLITLYGKKELEMLAGSYDDEKITITESEVVDGRQIREKVINMSMKEFRRDYLRKIGSEYRLYLDDGFMLTFEGGGGR